MTPSDVLRRYGKETQTYRSRYHVSTYMVARSLVENHGEPCTWWHGARLQPTAMVARSDVMIYGDTCVHGAWLQPTAMDAKNDVTTYGEPCVEVTLVSLAYAVTSDGESDEGDDTDFRMIDDAGIKALNQLRSLDSRRNTLR